jgi:hypothetical protein
LVNGEVSLVACHVRVDISWALSVDLDMFLLDVITVGEVPHCVEVDANFAHPIGRLGESFLFPVSVFDGICKFGQVSQQLLFCEIGITEFVPPPLVLQKLVFSDHGPNCNDLAIFVEERDNPFTQLNGSIDILNRDDSSTVANVPLTTSVSKASPFQAIPALLTRISTVWYFFPITSRNFLMLSEFETSSS